MTAGRRSALLAVALGGLVLGACVAAPHPELVDAARAGELERASALLDAGADPNASTTQGRVTALQEAAEAGNLELVRMLLDRGAAVDSVDSGGARPLMEAAQSANTAVVRLLLERGSECTRQAERYGHQLRDRSRGGH